MKGVHSFLLCASLLLPAFAFAGKSHNPKGVFLPQTPCGVFLTEVEREPNVRIKNRVFEGARSADRHLLEERTYPLWTILTLVTGKVVFPKGNRIGYGDLANLIAFLVGKNYDPISEANGFFAYPDLPYDIINIDHQEATDLLLQQYEEFQPLRGQRIRGGLEGMFKFYEKMQKEYRGYLLRVVRERDSFVE